MAKMRQKNHFEIARNSKGWMAKHKESNLEYSGKSSGEVYSMAKQWLAKNQGGVIAVRDEYGRHAYSHTIQPSVEPKNLFN